MDPKEVKKIRFEIPSEWSPLKDPRPEWRIKETQIQVKGDDAQKILGRKSSILGRIQHQKFAKMSFGLEEKLECLAQLGLDVLTTKTTM